MNDALKKFIAKQEKDRRPDGMPLWIADRKPESPEQKVQFAYHEAAHAVVAAGYGLKVREVDAVRGYTAFEDKRHNGDWMRRNIRATLAGAAMGAIRGEDPGAASDGAIALAHIVEVFGPVNAAPGILLDEAFATRRLLERLDMKEAVETLAQALIDKGRIGEDDLKAFLEPVFGGLGDACPAEIK